MSLYTALYILGLLGTFAGGYCIPRHETRVGGLFLTLVGFALIMAAAAVKP